jgi:hypothetical protein
VEPDENGRTRTPFTTSDDNARGDEHDAVARLRAAKLAVSADTKGSDVTAKADFLVDRTATVEKE